MAQREYNRHVSNTSHIEGNVIRKSQAAPKRRESVLPERNPEEVRRERERRFHAKKNAARATAFDRGYLIFVSVAMVVCGLVCCAFIWLQSDITTLMSSIADLESSVSDMRADNSAAETRLETSMTLNEISERAAELGLVYPSEDQIRYYSVQNDDFMNQY